jgi:hypothetical protein
MEVRQNNKTYRLQECFYEEVDFPVSVILGKCDFFQDFPHQFYGVQYRAALQALVDFFFCEVNQSHPFVLVHKQVVRNLQPTRVLE